MERIKIAQVITRMDWGGSPDCVRILCTYLNPQMYDVRLITGPTRYPSEKTKRFLEEFSSRVTLIPQLKREINPASDLTALFSLQDLFQREKFDIVHTHTAKAGILGRLAAHFSRRPVIIHTPHGHNFYGYFGPLASNMAILAERAAATFTDRIIALTNLESADLLKFRITAAQKISVICQGIELDRYVRPDDAEREKLRLGFAIAPDEIVAGMVGRLERVKGPGYFLEAAQQLAPYYPKAKFIFIGEGALRKDLERQAKKSPLAGRVIFTGWRDDTEKLISLLDILVLPSLNEAVGMVLIEAQVLGVPVIATNVGGISEIVNDGETGILVPAGNSQELAEAMAHLFTDTWRRSQMGEAGKSWVKGKFAAPGMITETSRLYQELVNLKLGGVNP